MAHRAIPTLLLALAGMFLAAPAANAGVASASGGLLLIGENVQDEPNNISVFTKPGFPGFYYVGENLPAASMQSGMGLCPLDGANDAKCPDSGIDTVSAFLHGGHDTFNISVAEPAEVFGGDAADSLFGGSQGDRLYGDAGNDDTHGGAGNDVLSDDGGSFDGPADGNDQMYGGAGDDSLDGGAAIESGAGSDSFDGGADTDTLTYTQRTTPLTITEDDGVANDGAAGEGDDVVNAEHIIGGSAGDSISGSAEANTLDGGPGDDTLDGGKGADKFAGAPGADTLTYASRSAAVTVTIGDGANDGEAGEGDDVGTDPETVIGGSAGDQLGGHDGVDNLDGGPGADGVNGAGGDDTLTGGAGKDTIGGGSGDDTIRALDGEADAISCGSGDDKVDADPIDTAGADCEQIQRGAVVDKIGPVVGLPAKIKVSKRGVARVPISCPRSEVDGCRAGKLELAAKSKKSAKAKKATAKFDIKGGATKTVKLKLKGKLRRARRAQLSATALDGAGNSGKSQRTVRLKRSR